MTVTDQYLANNAKYAETFEGPLPLPPSKHVAVVACMQRGMLTFTDDGFKQQIQDDTGLKPEWAAEAFQDVFENVRQSLRRIEASPFVTKHESLRGFVFDVATGKLNEVSL